MSEPTQFAEQPTWFAVVEERTGHPVSFGTVVADPLPSGLAAVALDVDPTQGAYSWDARSRSLVTAPDAPPPPPSPGAQLTATVTLADPLTVRWDDDTEAPVSRLASYLPTAGDRVLLSYLGGAWIVSDQILPAGGSSDPGGDQPGGAPESVPEHAGQPTPTA